MIHILTVHYVDKWIDIQLENLSKYIKEPFRVYTVLGENYEKHKDKFYYVEEGRDKHYNSLQKLHKVLDDENPNENDIIIVLDSDAFPIKSLDDYLEDKLKDYEFLAINAPEHNYEPLPIQPFECFYAFRYNFFSKYEFWFKFEPGIHSNWIDWMIDWFKNKSIEWYPLNRSSPLINLHPLYFGIYDDIIYHNWTGSRNPITRPDRKRIANTNETVEMAIEKNIEIAKSVFEQIENQLDDFMDYLRGNYEGELE